jgi:hypothetical protein
LQHQRGRREAPSLRSGLRIWLSQACRAARRR